MLHVNLIRERTQADIRVAKTALFCLVAVAISVLGSISFAVPSVRSKSKVVRETRALEKKYDEVKADEAAVKAQEAEYKSLKPVVNMVRECRWSAVDWLRVLMAIHRNLPDTVWLESIQSQCKAEEWRHTVTITGQATKHSEVAAVMEAIGQTNPFKNDEIRLVQTSETRIGDEEAYTQFVIEAELQYVIGENLH